MFYIQPAYISDRFEKSSLRSIHGIFFPFSFPFFFFCLNFLPLHSKIYIIFFKDLDGNFIYIHSYILASNFFSSFVRTFI